MDPLLLGAAAVTAAAALFTAAANWRLGRRTDETVRSRARAAAHDAASRAGFELVDDLHLRCERGGRTFDVTLIPLATTTHRSVTQRFRADVHVVPLRSIERATFRLSVRDLIEPGDIKTGHAALDRAYFIRGGDPVDVKAILGDADVARFLLEQVSEYVNHEGRTMLETRFRAVNVGDDGLHIEAAPRPPPATDGREPTHVELALAAVEFAATLADLLDRAHERAPRSVGVDSGRAATSAGGTSAGVRAL